MSKQTHFNICIVGGGMIGNALANTLAKARYTNQLKIAMINPAVSTNNNIFGTGNSVGIRTSALTGTSMKLLEKIQDKNKEIPMTKYYGMKVWDQDGNFLNLDPKENEFGVNSPFSKTANTSDNVILKSLSSIGNQVFKVGQSINDGLVKRGVGFSNVVSERKDDVIGSIVDNNDVVFSLMEASKKLDSISLFDRSELKAISDGQNPNTKKLIIQTTTEGNEKLNEEITCDLLIAADGATSFVRQFCNFPFYSVKYKQRAFVTNVYVDTDSVPCTGKNTYCYQQFLADGPIGMLPTKQNNVKNIIWSTDPSRAIALEAAYKSGNQQKVLEEMNSIFSKLRIVPRILTEKSEIVQYFPAGSFPLQRLNCKEYVQPGIALVGDAAHCCHPMAGQGVNMGFVDAIQLVKAIQKSVKSGSVIGDYSILKTEYEQIQYRRNELYLDGLDAIKGIFEVESQNDILKGLGIAGLARKIGMDVINSNPLNLKNALIGTAMAVDVDMSHINSIEN